MQPGCQGCSFEGHHYTLTIAFLRQASIPFAALYLLSHHSLPLHESDFRIVEVLSDAFEALA
jgi:hypothetical protein